MKKILVFIAPIIIIVVFFGCDKDHSSPTFGTFKNIPSPDSVLATYDQIGDVVDIEWNMDDTLGVVDYFIEVSDSSDFDSGTIYKNSFFGNTLTREFTYDASRFVPSTVDSLILYFTVSALFNNDTFNNFIGPRSAVDSALVYRK